MAHRIFALLLLIISTIDISFSQRKIPKHSVVTVDVKTAVHFDCPEEFGYYPHPDDCTQYYVCVFGGALLESCTGGLMYSQELQTCDWPRNVGCDGANVAPAATTPSTSSNSRVKEEYTRTRYTPPPPPKPSALVISRGQPRPQQIYHDEEINLKQQQLYQESEEALPEVQEEESDRQQRFYRGQPSSIGQVQRDRDGLRQSNAIAYHTSQKEKIGVISFGVHQAQDHQRTLTDYHLETLTDNKLTLTRRKKRQIIPSLNIDAPRSWSNVRTSNRVPFATLQSRIPTGPDKSPEWSTNNHRATTNKNFPLYTFRQTDFIPLPRGSYPSRHPSHKNININQYSARSLISTTPLYNSYKSTYYHLIPDKNRHRDNEINLATSNKHDSTSIQPSGFKFANHSHTGAITRAFDSVKFLTEKLPSKVLDSFNFQNTQNRSNIKLKASPFFLETTTQSSLATKSVSNSVTNSNINTSTAANIRKQKEFSTINPTKYRKNKYKEYDYYYYDDSIEEVPTTEPIVYRSRTPNKLPIFNVDSSSNYKQYQDLTNMTKFVEYKSRMPNNNGSKKNMIYSAKYKEELSIGKTSSTKKTIQDSSSTSLLPSQPQTTNIKSPTKPHRESLEQHSAFTLTTKAPTRSRTRQTTTTTLTRGKHRLQVTKHNSRNTGTVKDMKRADSTTRAPEPASATSRTLVSTSQYSANSYSPYEQEYDDKAKYEYNSYNEPQPSAAPVSYRSRTPAPSYQSLAQDDIQSSKRSNAIQNDYVRNIYQEQSVPEYHDVTYDNAEEDHNSYRQSNRQQIRDDRKESNLIEDQPTPKSKHRISTTYSSSTSRYTTKKPVKTSSSSVSHKQNTASSSVSSNASKESESLINLKQSHYVVPENTKAYTIPKNSQSRDLPQHTRDNSQLLSSKNNNNNLSRAPIPHNHIKDPISLDSIRTSQQIPITYRFITKKPPSESTLHVSFSGTPSNRNIYHSQNTFISSPISTSTSSPSSTQKTHSLKSSTQNIDISQINPTTYSPPKLDMNSFVPKTSSLLNTQSRARAEDSENSSFSSQNKKSRERSSTSRQQYQNDYPNRAIKEVKFIRKIFPVNPVSINKALSPVNIKNESVLPEDLDEHVEISTSKVTESPTQFFSQTAQRYLFKEKKKIFSSTNRAVTIAEKSEPEFESPTTPIKTSSVITNTESNINLPRISSQEQLILEKINRYRNSSLINPNYISKTKTFNSTVELPPLKSLISNEEQIKEEPDLPPTYKLKPFKLLSKNSKNKTDYSSITTTPRISRINPAFKFTMNAFRGTKGHNSKCNETTSIQICSDLKYLRTSNRGRGTGHYTSGNVVTNDVTVNTINVNRGTPPPRSRPTLKPSTSIVSKAQEFVDIYRYPPRRPDPLYPQPQPDKTAAKCRKDVCLLPDCNCGGKDIPGDIPPEQVPQIVLLTFDDSVNDLNKGLYQDLFEKGRVNPNGCPISATFYVSHEWTDYSQVQNLYSDGHEIASHTVSHSFGEQFSQKKWTREVAGQREILAAYGGVHLEDVRGMRAPFLSVGGNKMFKMLYDSNFTYDSSMPIYENKPPSWPYTLDYKLFHDCMIPPCPTRSYPGVWEVPMVMWQDLNGGRCSMGDACSNPSEPEGVRKMIMKNFMRHYTTNRAPFGLFYHAAWFTQPHHKEGFINLLDDILAMKDVWVLTNWQAVEWVRDPTPTSRLGSFKPFQCDYSDRPKRCNNPKVCNLWHKSGVRYMRTCQPCPEIYPWTGNSGIRSSRIDNDIED